MTDFSTLGQKIHDWVMARLDDGMIVYAQTYLQTLKIRPKDRDMLRLHNGHFEVQRGKHWESLNGCKFTATR